MYIKTPVIVDALTCRAYPEKNNLSSGAALQIASQFEEAVLTIELGGITVSGSKVGMRAMSIGACLRTAVLHERSCAAGQQWASCRYKLRCQLTMIEPSLSTDARHNHRGRLIQWKTRKLEDKQSDGARILIIPLAAGTNVKT